MGFYLKWVENVCIHSHAPHARKRRGTLGLSPGFPGFPGFPRTGTATPYAVVGVLSIPEGAEQKRTRARDVANLEGFCDRISGALRR